MTAETITQANGVQITIDPSRAEQRRAMNELRKDMRDQKVPYAKCSIFLDGWVQRNFKTEGGNVGGWKKFAVGGRRRKGKGIDTSAKLLQDTGRLRLSFKPFATKSDAGIGSDLPYSKNHDEGVDVPQRRILPQKKEVWPKVKEIFNKHVEQVIKGFKL